MKTFWTFYQNLEDIAHPFRVFGLAHLGYVVGTFALIFWILKAYQRQGQTGKHRWENAVAVFLFVQEIFYYGWIYVGCQTNVLFEVLHLELCTFCVFAGASTVFHKNKQVRFFAALVGLLGAPIAIAYPATVADIYPAFCYRIIGFYLSHGALVLFSLMMLSDETLLTNRRLLNNMGILALMLILVYGFNLRFGIQYMFVGNPPEIGIVRLVFDLTGPFFLPVAIVILSLYQWGLYWLVKKLRQKLYPMQGARNA